MLNITWNSSFFVVVLSNRIFLWFLFYVGFFVCLFGLLRYTTCSSGTLTSGTLEMYTGVTEHSALRR